MRVIILIFILSSLFSLQAKEIEILPESKCEYEILVRISSKQSLKEGSNSKVVPTHFSIVKLQEETISNPLISDSVPIYLRQCKLLN
jgi:hypothetical protein